MPRNRDSIVRASDLGLHAYCARAWWLSRVKGHRSINQAALAAGQAAHQAHGQTVAGYHRLQRAALILWGLALLAGLTGLLMVTMK